MKKCKCLINFYSKNGALCFTKNYNYYFLECKYDNNDYFLVYPYEDSEHYYSLRVREFNKHFSINKIFIFGR
jgi:hypothetical protein